jgi:hypothetical protein
VIEFLKITATHRVASLFSWRTAALGGALAVPALSWGLRTGELPPPTAGAQLPVTHAAGALRAQSPPPPPRTVADAQLNSPADPGRAAGGKGTVAQPVASTPPEAPAPKVTPDRTATGKPVLFLTIVGKEVYLTWGREGDRPPRVDALGEPVSVAADLAGDAGAVAETSGETTIAAAVAPAAEPTYGGTDPDNRPFGPAPQQCPRTLPAGSTQATADALRGEAGCRYLSSCDSDGSCTWYYQGRG